MSEMINAKDEAVRAAGGSSKLAPQLIGHNGRPLTRQAVDDWTIVPPKHVLRVEEISGVDRSRLRPDIYPPERKRPLRRRINPAFAAA